MRRPWARPRVGARSPWGTIQHVTSPVSGRSDIIAVGTAGHGGLWVTPELAKRLPRDWETFVGPYWNGGLPVHHWHEQDCDAVMLLALLGMAQHREGAQNVARGGGYLARNWTRIEQSGFPTIGEAQ